MTEKVRAQKESVLSQGEIQRIGDTYISTLHGGTSTVALPQTIGDMMYRMLRIQDKLGERLEGDLRTRALISMLNCRKTAAIASGTLSPRDAVTQGREKLSTAEQIREALEDPFAVDEDGILDMLRDCQRMLASGAVAAIWTPQAERITAQLRDEKFPKVVHVFGPKEADVLPLLTKIATRSLSTDDLLQMGFIHTFIISGKGEDGTYHCFHKQGPSTHEHLEVTSLEDLFTHIFATSMDRPYLSIVGPLQS